MLRQGSEVNQMMKVVGEEGTSIEDFVVYLKSEFLDAAYLQQDSFHDVDGATSADRQKYVFDKVNGILNAKVFFPDKDAARKWFLQLTSVTKDWNRVEMDIGGIQATGAAHRRHARGGFGKCIRSIIASNRSRAA